MKTKLYLIPITPAYHYEPYDHIVFINAASPQDAYQKAKDQLHSNIPQKSNEYECYDIDSSNTQLYNILGYAFPESQKYDILNVIFQNTKGFEHMAYFNCKTGKQLVK